MSTRALPGFTRESTRLRAISLTAVTTAEATVEATTAPAVAASVVVTRRNRVIVTDWIEGRKTLAIATGMTRITQATFGTAAARTVRDFAEGTISATGSMAAIADN